MCSPFPWGLPMKITKEQQWPSTVQSSNSKIKKKRFSFLLYIRKWNNTTEISELENENKKTHPEKIYFILGNGTI